MKMKKNSKVIIKILKLILKCTPFLFIFSVVLNLFHGLSYGLITLTEQHFFDSVSMYFKDQSTIRLIVALILFALAYISSEILNALSNFIVEVVIDKTTGRLDRTIHNKINKISAVKFEDSNNLDFINKAVEGKNNAVVFASLFANLIVFYVPYFIFMFVYLLRVSVFLPLTLIFVFIPVVLTQYMKMNEHINLEEATAPIRRKVGYYDECITGRESYKETRHLGAVPFFLNKYDDSLKQLHDKIAETNKKINNFELKVSFITIAGYVMIVGMLIYLLMKSDISIGAFAAIFASVRTMFSMMEEMIKYHIGNMASEIGNISNFINFMEIDEVKDNDREVGKCDIHLKNVSFSYPSSSNNVLQNIDLDILHGEKIAIIGENGSGKTTLAKIILGIYEPSKGRIIYGNENDFCDHVGCNKNSGISYVSQNYKRYKMTLKENICLSNVRDSVENKDDQILKICNEVDLDFQQSDLMQNLSTEFGGQDLSGGQWQRVAIARGLYRNSDLIVLDEPTAAIDPVEETYIYNKFKQIISGLTGVLITHRLGATKIVDKIVVLKEGGIIGIGSHNELMKTCKYYSDLYEEQRKWYM